MTAGTRISIAAGVITAITGYMAYLGASSSWRYYLTVDECVADASRLLGCPLRVNGHIAAQSVEINADRSSATFVLQGSRHELRAVCVGPLPDNLAEDMDVVVEGSLEGTDLLRGEKVLTRCASKYQSQEPPSAVASASADSEEAAP